MNKSAIGRVERIAWRTVASILVSRNGNLLSRGVASGEARWLDDFVAGGLGILLGLSLICRANFSNRFVWLDSRKDSGLSIGIRIPIYQPIPKLPSVSGFATSQPLDMDRHYRVREDLAPTFGRLGQALYTPVTKYTNERYVPNDPHLAGWSAIWNWRSPERWLPE